MSVVLIHHCTARTPRCYDAHLVRGPQAKLGVLSHVYLASEGSDAHAVNELALINLHTQRCEHIVTYQGFGPTEHNWTEDARLRYDPVQNRWVIAQLQYGSLHDRVGMRTFKVEVGGGLHLSPLCLLEQEFASLGGIYPLLDLEVRADIYRFLYHQRETDDLWVPRIMKIDVKVPEAGTRWKNAWQRSEQETRMDRRTGRIGCVPLSSRLRPPSRWTTSSCRSRSALLRPMPARQAT